MLCIYPPSSYLIYVSSAATFNVVTDATGLSVCQSVAAISLASGQGCVATPSATASPSKYSSHSSGSDDDDDHHRLLADDRTAPSSLSSRSSTMLIPINARRRYSGGRSSSSDGRRKLHEDDSNSDDNDDDGGSSSGWTYDWRKWADSGTGDCHNDPIPVCTASRTCDAPPRAEN
jgi:hypothetical protein